MYKYWLLRFRKMHLKKSGIDSNIVPSINLCDHIDIHSFVSFLSDVPIFFIGSQIKLFK